MTATEFVLYCPPHRHYLVRASVGGTTWTDDQDAARRYPTKPAARHDLDLATWRDHRPTVWAVPERTAEL